ncbi:MAG: ExbD/TolR family protein [Phycisphaerae bacterium]
MNQLATGRSRAAWKMRAGRTGGALRRARPTMLTLNLVPMIDIVFNLLIFFLVGTRFTVAEGVLASRLPRTAGQPPELAVPVVPIRVRLTARPDGGCSIVIENQALRPPDFAQLAVVLKQIQHQPGFDNQTPVILLAEQRLQWDHVVNAYNAALRAGYTNIVFAGP